MAARKIPENLGPKLKAIREHFGYTLNQMADAVGKKGKSRRTRVYEWENGSRQPDLECLLAYAELVDLSTDELIDDSVVLRLEQLPPIETKTKEN